MNCGASFKGVSLNDQLIQSPDLTNFLVGVLTRFREDPVAFMAIVEAMFHQFRVPPEQCDFLRFLWWPNGNLDAPLQEYRMVVHLFGAVSSPSIANFAIKKTASDVEEDYGPLVARTLQRNFYVADCDPDDSNPLTPAHLLTMKTSVVLPPPTLQRKDIYMRHRWRRVQYLANLFWSHWKKEYLVTLQERQKWNKPMRNLSISDVVLIKDDQAPRKVWLMGRVIEREPDKEGLLRSV